MFCLHCGNELNDTAKFCPFCGKPVVPANVPGSIEAAPGNAGSAPAGMEAAPGNAGSGPAGMENAPGNIGNAPVNISQGNAPINMQNTPAPPANAPMNAQNAPDNAQVSLKKSSDMKAPSAGSGNASTPDSYNVAGSTPGAYNAAGPNPAANSNAVGMNRNAYNNPGPNPAANSNAAGMNPNAYNNPGPNPVANSNAAGTAPGAYNNPGSTPAGSPPGTNNNASPNPWPDNNNPDSTPGADQNGGYYKEYHFKSQVKGKSLELGPVTLAEGYSTKTDLIVDSKDIKYAQSRFLRKPKQGDIDIASIQSIETGLYCSIGLLLIFIAIMAALAFTEVSISMAIGFRLGIAIALLVGVMFEILNTRATIKVPGMKFFFDSRDSKGIKTFVEDMKWHPSFQGQTKKKVYPIQLVLLGVLLVCIVVLVVKPNPFASRNLYDGTYNEWKEAYYRGSCKTLIAADVTVGIDDSESDALLVGVGDYFEETICISDANGSPLKKWKWLHEAEPIEDTVAVFEVILTHYRNENSLLSEETFIVTDPRALTYDEYLEYVGVDPEELLETSEADSYDQYAEDKSTAGVEESTPSVEETTTAYDTSTSAGQGNYTDYLDWNGYYDGGWMETGLYFVLYTDGSEGTDCGYMELDFRGNYDSGMLFYEGDNKFYCMMELSKSEYYLYAVKKGGQYTLDIYNTDSYECTYTMIMTIDEYMDYVDEYSTANEYIVDGSDSGYFDKSYFENLTDEELRLARNEIFARHGRMFNDPQLQSYFDSKSWYTPIYTPEEFDANMERILNEWEKANVETIKKVEASRK